MCIRDSRCTPAGWLSVDLRDPRSANPFAVGATVRVWTQGVMHQRTVSAGSTGFGSGGPPVLHFGLGDTEWVDRVDIIWPDGSISTAPGFEPRREVLFRR